METWAGDILKTAQGTKRDAIRQVKVTVRAETSEGGEGG